MGTHEDGKWHIGPQLGVSLGRSITSNKDKGSKSTGAKWLNEEGSHSRRVGGVKKLEL